MITNSNTDIKYYNKDVTNMSLTFTEGRIEPFGKCLFISNGSCEAAVTLDVGPRVISLKALGGENFMYQDINNINNSPAINEAYGKGNYLFYGGHRLWWTPERIPETYYPDGDPVDCKIDGNTVTLTPPAQPSGVQLVMSLTMDPELPVVSIDQKVTNLTDQTNCHAAWGITQCRPGGVAVAPQNTRQPVLLPNRLVVHWPYNDMNDVRYYAGDKYITLSYGNINRSFKFGTNNEAGWCGYALDGQLLYKEFGFDEKAGYPDYGCNFESYTDAKALEIECLSAEVPLAPGESIDLHETWRIIPLTCGKEMPCPKSEEFVKVIDEALASFR